ncbi:hypothetical protein BDD12DRAFT_823314 [Trichophaea hybrida]|nr:hypothetical protein BDD12DRAFT_823314 [Trichophaea hybrida]
MYVSSSLTTILTLPSIKNFCRSPAYSPDKYFDGGHFPRGPSPHRRQPAINDYRYRPGRPDDSSFSSDQRPQLVEKDYFISEATFSSSSINHRPQLAVKDHFISEATFSSSSSNHRPQLATKDYSIPRRTDTGISMHHMPQPVEKDYFISETTFSSSSSNHRPQPAIKDHFISETKFSSSSSNHRPQPAVRDYSIPGQTFSGASMHYMSQPAIKDYRYAPVGQNGPPHLNYRPTPPNYQSENEYGHFGKRGYVEESGLQLLPTRRERSQPPDINRLTGFESPPLIELERDIIQP